MNARHKREHVRHNAARVIKDARTLGNVSQVRLAQLLGISQPLVSSWERGRVTPGLDDVARIEDLLGMQRGELYVQIVGGDE